jgi:XRE family transcriptional regulator, fatty acid utilization regulator
VVHAQVSQYWQTHNRYFCITIAKPFNKTGSIVSSVTIGLLIDPKLTQTMPIVNDHSVPVKTVHTTCERCGIMDCMERAARPLIIEKQEEKEKVTENLKMLEE